MVTLLVFLKKLFYFKHKQNKITNNLKKRSKVLSFNFYLAKIYNILNGFVSFRYYLVLN